MDNTGNTDNTLRAGDVVSLTGSRRPLTVTHVWVDSRVIDCVCFDDIGAPHTVRLPLTAIIKVPTP